MRALGLKLLGVALAGSMASACATQRPLYQWGHYEEAVASHREDELRTLLDQIEATGAMGARVPPGLHAHVGYLYAQSGDASSAKAHFLMEKSAFPESAAFMNWMLAKLEEKR